MALYCTHPGCKRAHSAMGLCPAHYISHQRKFGRFKNDPDKHREAQRRYRQRQQEKREQQREAERLVAERRRAKFPEVQATVAWPDPHREAPGGQRLAIYVCPHCGSDHLVAWGPFEQHPGEKMTSCRPKGVPQDRYVTVLAPEVVLDAPPLDRRDRDVPLPKVKRVKYGASKPEVEVGADADYSHAQEDDRFRRFRGVRKAG